jgi:hypothetical protein
MVVSTENYKKSDEFKDAIIIPHAKDRKEAAPTEPKMVNVYVSRKIGESGGKSIYTEDLCSYEKGIYAAIVSVAPKGTSADLIRRIAQQHTLTASESGGDYYTAATMIKERIVPIPELNIGQPTTSVLPIENLIKSDIVNQVVTETKSAAKPLEDTVRIARPMEEVKPMPTQTEPPIDMTPKVKVQFRGPFGTIRTRYHEVSLSTNKQPDGKDITFLVLVFNTNCSTADMYEPPIAEGILEVTVGSGSEKKVFPVMSIGICFELTKQELQVIVLPVGQPSAAPDALTSPMDDATPFA